MATNTKTVEIEVKAKDNASKTLDNVAKKSSSMADKIKENLGKIRVASGVATAGLVALGKSFVDASIENEPLQKSFERLSESAGIASDEMLKAMRNASKGTVADTNLMAQANKAYALGIVSSAEDMATMIEIARLKGQAMGRTMEEALGDITTGLGRGSAQILDNLGIVVNAEEANEAYAKSIGKVASELTEAEKKQALVNAVVSQGKKELEEAGEVPLTMAEKMQVLNATWSNTQNVIGDALVPVLDKLLQKITPIITKVAEWIEKNPELTADLVLIATGLSGLVFACSTVIPAISSVVSVLSGLATFITSGIGPALTGLITLLSGPVGLVVAIGAVVGGLAYLDTKLKTNEEKIAEYREEIKKLDDDYRAGLIPQDEYTARVELLNQKISECEANHRTFGGYLRDNFIQTLHEVMNPLDTMKQLNSDIEYWTNQAKISFVNRAVSISKDVIPIIDKLIGYLKSARDWLKKVASMLGSGVSSAANTVSGRVDSAKSLVGFANGGSVQGNVPIIVGEKGPEIFVPNNSGRIIPNDEIQGGTNINVNISGVSVRSDNDITALAQEMIRQIKLEKQFGIS